MFGSVDTRRDFETAKAFMMKIAVFVYSQSGQAYDAARSIFGLSGRADADGAYENMVIFKTIQPEQVYPFPWDRKTFFDVFPETRLGLPPSGIRPVDLSDVEDADLVVIVGQSWFLSPSLPLQSFFGNEQVKRYLRGRNVVFVNVCRNMWLKTIQWVKSYLGEVNARLVGHIVLQDRNHNLVSVVTIVRWLLYGKKESTWILPCAGVSDEDVRGARRFGSIVRKAVAEGRYGGLQEEFLSAGAICYRPSIVHIEKIGHRMFGFWARFIRRKGGLGCRRRWFRVELFYVYLIAVLFLVSPFVQMFFYLTYPLRRVGRNRQADCAV